MPAAALLIALLVYYLIISGRLTGLLDVYKQILASDIFTPKGKFWKGDKPPKGEPTDPVYDPKEPPDDTENWWWCDVCLMWTQDDPLKHKHID